jgi:hypothetical protein
MLEGAMDHEDRCVPAALLLCSILALLIVMSRGLESIHHIHVPMPKGKREKVGTEQAAGIIQVLTVGFL